LLVTGIASTTVTTHHITSTREGIGANIQYSFLRQKQIYAEQSALVFRNIDYLMMTVKLLRKDYKYLARCVVPIGKQVGLSIDEIAGLLKTKTRRFTEDEIRVKFKRS